MGLFSRHSLHRKSSVGKKALFDADVALANPSLVPKNKHAKNPDFHPVVTDSKLLILGDFPDVVSDAMGIHHRGGKRLLRPLRVHNPSADYICRTLPTPDKKGIYKSTDESLASYRRAVEGTIKEQRPLVIAALGLRVANWLIPGFRDSAKHHWSIDNFRGRVYPAEVAGVRLWVVVLMDIATFRRRRGREEFTDADDWERTWARDLDTVEELLEDERPKVLTEAELSRGTEISIFPDAELLDRFLGSVEGRVGVDVETEGGSKGLDPRLGGRLTTIAFSTRDRAVAITVDHPEATHQNWKCLIPVLKKHLPRLQLVAHNAQMEQDWMAHWFGEWVLTEPEWHCTQIAAYLLGFYPGGQTLNHQALAWLGLNVKALSGEALWEQRGKLRELLEYNAIDARTEAYLFEVQRAQLEYEDCWRCYEHRKGWSWAFTATRRRGMFVDQKRRVDLVEMYKAQLKEAQARLAGCEDVQQFKEQYGAFNPSSESDVCRLFGSDSADEAALIQAGSPSAVAILDCRRPSKILATYLQKLDPGVKDSYIRDCCWVHPSFQTTRTDTGRSACVAPNAQNQPKRKAKVVREVYAARPYEKPPHDIEHNKHLRELRRNLIVSIDLGQIEWRVIAMESKDPYTRDAIIHGEDVHKIWAEALHKAYPRAGNKRGLDAKGRRGATKNEFVFPLCFGAGAAKVSAGTGVPQPIVEPIIKKFWAQLSGTRAWQQEMYSDYARDGYLTTSFGMRLRGPIRRQKRINGKIQSAAAYLTCHAHKKCVRYAAEMGKPWYIPIVNIHDDLTFDVPAEEIPALIETVMKFMTNFDFSFIGKIPIIGEPEVGCNMGQMRPLESGMNIVELCREVATN